MRRRVISVTRRHIEFLFGTCKVSAPFFTRSEDMPNSFNREETVVYRIVYRDTKELASQGAWRSAEDARNAITRWQDRHDMGGRPDISRDMLLRMEPAAEGDWQLPPSDESKVGLD